MKKSASLLGLLFLVITVLAQSNEEKHLKISSISFQNGTYYFHDNYGGTLNQFQQIVPESELLNQNLDDFNQYFYESDPNYSGAFSVQLAFDWLRGNENWNRLNPQLKFGFSYGSINLIRGNLNKMEYFRIDTLVSNSNGQEYYVDSVDSEDYTLNYDADFLVVDASLIIGSNPMSRWSFYGGVGMSAGINFNATARVFNTKDQYIDSRGNYNSPRYAWNPEFKEEVYRKNEAGIALMLGVPMGVNFRLSKKKKVWENFSFFLELRPSITYFKVSELDGSLYAASFNSFGVKYRFLE